MKLSEKQKEALRKVELCIPSWVTDWKSDMCMASGWGHVGVFVEVNKTKNKFIVSDTSPIREDVFGVTPEEAFFMRTERGRFPTKVTDLGKLVALLWGQRWMAAYIKMRKEGYDIDLDI
jgi:hypothetical protein